MVRSSKQALDLWHTRFNLVTKLSIGFGLILTFTLLLAVATFIQVQILSANFDQLEQARIRTNLVGEIRLAAINRVAATLDQLWSGRQDTNLATLEESKLLSSYFAQLRQKESQPGQVSRLDSLEGQTNELLNLLNQIIDLDRQGKTIQARGSWVKGSVLFTDLSQAMSNFVQTEEAALQATYSQVNQVRNSTILTILGLSGLTFLVAIGLALVITRSIVGRVKMVNLAMQRVVNDNNLDIAQLEVNGRDELANMSRSFNHMLAKLGSAWQALQRTGQTVSSSSAHFSELMQNQLTVAEQEASAIGAIAGAATQLSQAATYIDEHAGTIAVQARDNLVNITSLSKAVLQASRQVTKTHEIARTVANGINRMFTETSRAHSEVQGLVDELYALQKLAHELKGIAQDTHLLSLNAAIESAGAGPYGERFAVVAASVKNLANHSQRLVANMSGFVKEIETKVNNVTSAMSQTDQELANSRQLIELIERIGYENIELGDEMSEAIQKISNLVNETVSQNQTIAHATREQRHATEEIITTITSVEKAIQNNMQHYNKSVGAVNSLHDEVGRLNSLVGSFQVSFEASPNS